MSAAAPTYMTQGEERLWQALLAVTQELSVTRDRVDLLERTLVARGVLAAGDVDSLELDEQAVGARSAARLALVDRLIEPLRGQD